VSGWRRAWRPDPGALVADVAELVRHAAPSSEELVIRSDEHPAYPRAFRRLSRCAIRHECTPSVLARTPGNPLFPANLADSLLRHNSANHKRETIAFSKRHQSVVERAAVLILWRNFTKPFSENHDGGTPAMRVGIRSRAMGLAELVDKRLFPFRVGLTRLGWKYYRRLVPTARIANPRRHELRHAF